MPENIAGGIINTTSSNLSINDKIIEIPYPYKSFNDTPFFLIDSDTGLLIPERCYEKRKDKETNTDIIKFLVELNSLNLKNSNIKFVFLHNENKANINKYEFSFKFKDYSSPSEGDINNNTTFEYNLSNLQNFNNLYNSYNTFQIYFDRKLIFPETHYKIDFENKKLSIYNIDVERIKPEDKGNYYFDILWFYSGSTNKNFIQNLPQSGYIYLNTDEIDRNYNKNLMALFVDGTLIDRKNILQISNNIFKINTDIGKRYDLNILNLSPKIDMFVPFYHKFDYRDITYTSTIKKTTEDINPTRRVFSDTSLNLTDEELNISLPDIPGNSSGGIYNNENPDDVDPTSVKNNPIENYLNLTNLKFTKLKSDKFYLLKAYKDKFTDVSQKLNIIATINSYDDIDIDENQDFTPINLATLPVTLTSTKTKDELLINISLKDLILKFFPKNYTQSQTLFTNKERIERILKNISIQMQITQLNLEDENSNVYYELTTKLSESSSKMSIQYIADTMRSITKPSQDSQNTNTEQYVEPSINQLKSFVEYLDTENIELDIFLWELVDLLNTTTNKKIIKIRPSIFI